MCNLVELTIYDGGSVESGTFVWHCWCSDLSFDDNTSWDSNTSGKFHVVCAWPG